MPATRADLMARLDDLAIPHRTVEHAPLFTVEESKRLRGKIPGAHTKNLFLADRKGAMWLVVALESTPVALKGLHRRLGCGRLSFGRPEQLMQALGVAPGSVTPFALINDRAVRVSVAIDRRLMAEEELNFHPLENTATTRIPRDGLLAFIASCGHRPRVIDLTAAPGAGAAP